MDTIAKHLMEQKQKTRYQLLLMIYKASDADTQRWFDLRQLAEGYDIKGAEFRTAHQYLMDEGLIKPYGAGFTSMITHEGIKAIEESLKYPSKASLYFPPADEMDIPNGVK